MDLAVAHKDYDVAGGGERLAERLAQCFDAPMYTGFVNFDNRSDIRADVRGLWQDGLASKLIRRGGVTRQVAYQYLWEHADELRNYDVVIQSGNEPLWYVPTDDQLTIAYTHSTPRVQYDLHHRLWDSPSTFRGWAGGLLAHTYNRVVRQMYLHVTKFPDLWVANSELVARRIQRYFGVPREKIRVVYPPVPVDDFGPEHASDHRGEFYLCVNRLDEWKRVDEIVDAFTQLDHRVLIAGKGPEKTGLEDRASDLDNVELLGYVSDKEKRELLASAKALVYTPLNEDFGMVPIEALASGTPVLAVDDGYQPWQLEDGHTGLLFDRDDNRDVTVRNLRAAVRQFEAEGVTADAEELVAAAAPYSIDRFSREMHEAIEYARDRAIICPGRERDAEVGALSPALEDTVVSRPDPATAQARTDGGGDDE